MQQSSLAFSPSICGVLGNFTADASPSVKRLVDHMVFDPWPARNCWGDGYSNICLEPIYDRFPSLQVTVLFHRKHSTSSPVETETFKGGLVTQGSPIDDIWRRPLVRKIALVVGCIIRMGYSYCYIVIPPTSCYGAIGWSPLSPNRGDWNDSHFPGIEYSLLRVPHGQSWFYSWLFSVRDGWWLPTTILSIGSFVHLLVPHIGTQGLTLPSIHELLHTIPICGSA